MILLSFDLLNNEPETAGHSIISENVRTEITIKNTNGILSILEMHDVKATFFVEVSMVENLRVLLKKIIAQGHEVSFFNRNSSLKELEEAKFSTEKFLGKGIRGIRQKHISLDLESLKQLEFTYVSNIENAGVLFPFQRLKRSTEIQEKLGMTIVPESISPYAQLPYNDFVFQMMPFAFYRNMVFETLKSEEFVMIYLDSRQFIDYSKYKFTVPFYRKWNSGRKMEDKLMAFLEWINEKEFATSRMKDYLF